MQPSQRIVEFVKTFEQCRLVAYKPTPRDVPTLGWGSTGPDIHLGMSWTQADADERFAVDFARFALAVTKALTGETNQNQFDALTSLAYNIGLRNLGNSTLLKKHNAGDHEGAALEFPKWDLQAGTVLQGLVRRRAAEQAIYEERA